MLYAEFRVRMSEELHSYSTSFCFPRPNTTRWREARIKVETLDFTKNGVIDRAVTTVFSDAVSLGRVRLRQSRGCFRCISRCRRRRSGWTGNRRGIEYLLSPLLKLKDEAFGET